MSSGTPSFFVLLRRGRPSGLPRRCLGLMGAFDRMAVWGNAPRSATGWGKGGCFWHRMPRNGSDAPLCATFDHRMPPSGRMHHFGAWMCHHLARGTTWRGIVHHQMARRITRGDCAPLCRTRWRFMTHRCTICHRDTPFVTGRHDMARCATGGGKMPLRGMKKAHANMACAFYVRLGISQGRHPAPS